MSVDDSWCPWVKQLTWAVFGRVFRHFPASWLKEKYTPHLKKKWLQYIEIRLKLAVHLHVRRKVCHHLLVAFIWSKIIFSPLRYYLSLERASCWSIIWKKIESPASLSFFRPSGFGEGLKIKTKCSQYIFVLSPWKRGWPFIWTPFTGFQAGPYFP